MALKRTRSQVLRMKIMLLQEFLVLIVEKPGDIVVVQLLLFFCSLNPLQQFKVESINFFVDGFRLFGLVRHGKCKTLF